MDDAGPVRRLTPRARLALRGSIVLAWAIGVGGSAVSCLTLKYYQSPRPAEATVGAAPPPLARSSSSPSASSSASPSSSSLGAPSASPSIATAPSAAPVAAVHRESSEAQVALFADALERFRRRRIPLAVADLLLSLALVVGAARTLARRPGAKSWLRQVCAATALFALAEFVARREERGYLADHLAALSPEQDARRVRSTLEWGYTALLAAQLALFGGLVIALGRPSVVLELAPEPARGSLPPPSTDGEP